MSDSFTWLDATAQAELVRTGQVSAKELVEAAIERIEALNPTVNAVTWTRYDAARAEAAGESTGAFAGVPILFKDLGCAVAGEPLTYGLGPLRDVPWPTTSYLAQQFGAAGFINLGRSNVPELGTTVTTEPMSFPAARNPWNPDHSTGGSSGGAAAAVSSGMVPVAHASDGGGSIRIPASECGLVGLKPTRARVSKGPRGSENWAGGSIDGVLTRTVRDAAAALDAISTVMPGEPYYPPPLPRPLAGEVNREPEVLRIGFLDRAESGFALNDPECSAAVANTATLLESLGHRVEPGGPAALFDAEFGRHFVTVIAADTALFFREVEALLGRPIADQEVEPRNARYRAAGNAIDAPTYIAARAGIGVWAREMAAWWARSDVLLTPTLAAPPPRLGWFTAEGPDREGPRIASLSPYTAAFNMTGQPAISLPLHWTADGLPVGVQFVAAYGREDVLVRLAAQLEKAAPWADKRPRVHA
jgi:amidase